MISYLPLWIAAEFSGGGNVASAGPAFGKQKRYMAEKQKKNSISGDRTKRGTTDY